MIVGISKRQWLLILIAVAIVLLINFIGIWYFLRWYEITKTRTWICDYAWPKTILEAMVVAVLLGALAWLVVYISRRAFFQGLSPILKYGSGLLVAVGMGAVFAKVSIGFSDIWVDDFWCGPMLGLLWSGFVHFWSSWLIFPATSALVFWAMCLSGGDRGEKGGERRPTP